MSDYRRAPGHTDQPGNGTPPPDPVTESIRAELLARQRVGWRKYGVGLGRGDFSTKDWLHHLYEELLDAAQYSKRLILTLEGQLMITPTMARWRHLKRQSTYVEIGRGELQASTHQPQEGDILVAYRDEADGKIWFRYAPEFDDGRYEKLPPTITPKEELSRAQEIESIQRQMAEMDSRLRFLVLGDPRERVTVPTE